MNYVKRIISYLLVAAVGAVLVFLGIKGTVDSFWSGMGSALIVVSALRFIQMYRYSKDDKYRERLNTEVSDERNRFIRSKAWAWAGYLFILISAVASIAFRVLGQELLSYAASVAVFLIVVLYWVANVILKRKY